MPPTNKKAGAAKFKKYAVLAGSGSSRRAVIAFVNRAEIAATTRTASQTIEGRADPKRPAHSIASESREARFRRHGQDGGVRPDPVGD